MPKIIVTVIMPSKGDKLILNQFFDEPDAFEDQSIEQFYKGTVLPKIDKADSTGPLHKAAIVLRGGETTRTQTRGALPCLPRDITRSSAQCTYTPPPVCTLLPARACAGGPEIDCTDITDPLDDYVGMQLSKIVFYVDQIGVQQAFEPEVPLAQLQRQPMYEVPTYL
jgi:hypothetical protein